MYSMLKYCVCVLMALALPTIAMADELPDRRAEPSDHTAAANARVRAALPFDDVQDFEDAQRGLLAPLDPLTIEACETTPKGERCKSIWDLTKYDFLNPHLEADIGDFPFAAASFPESPASVNPSLWRNAVLNTIHGVFEVVDDQIFQVRGYDLSNMSAVVGQTGWIIIDPLTAKETASAALANLNVAYADETGNEPMPVSAVIFTHSHVDHFGGVEGLGLTGSEPIIAPDGFFEEAVSENVIVGNAMGRRASYMYGPLLQRGETGQVDGGLGKSTPAGTTGIRNPNCVVSTGAWDDGCESVAGISRLEAGSLEKEGLVLATVDGVDIEFQNVPGSEAPAEILFYFPAHEALCASEDVTHTFHNVLTLRGANVRDSLLWAKYLDKTLDYFSGANVIFASHHWPTWNTDLAGTDLTEDRVAHIVEQQRDLYRYIHDQSVRFTNQGYTIQEVGELVKLPDSLGNNWFNRDYYGTVNHNAKAVYQRYIGWFDANPASLHQLPPAAAASEYVRYMGGPEAILEKAKADYDAGRYRWVAMVLNHVVFSTGGGEQRIAGRTIYDPIREARLLLADTYDQLGYQAESGPWRNFYLTGAMELRNGVLPLPAVKTFTRDTVKVMDLEMVFDFLAVHINGRKAGAMDYTYQLAFYGDNEGGEDSDSALYLKNGVLNYDIDETLDAGQANATFRLTRSLLNSILMDEVETLFCAEGTGVGDAGADQCVVVEGDREAALDLGRVLDQFEFWFNIVTPNPPPVSIDLQ